MSNLLFLFALVLSTHAVILPGASLQLAWCNASSSVQQFIVSGNTLTSTDGKLCATMTDPYPAPLTMAPCASPPSPTQQWSYNVSTSWPLAFTAPNATGDGSCLLMNSQGGPGYEQAGSTIGVYACSSPTPFDSVFLVNYPGPGLISEKMTSPGNTTFSNLCFEAVNPSPPPLPTPEQVNWLSTEMACFIHFNMATAVGSQGCGGCDAAPPDISAWNPSNLNTDAWVDAGVAMGCKRFIYVAKHGCGLCTWPTAAQIAGQEYPYSVKYAQNKTDVVSLFVASARKAGVGYGFYYSVGQNAKCNACSGHVASNPRPGQLNVTQDQFDALVIQQLTELWTNYGALTEVWFDGGYPPSQAAAIKNLFETLQPKAVAFGAGGLTTQAARWVGTESGYAPYPCWGSVNNVLDDGAGSPNGGFFVPAETDFTLQNGDNWFYSQSAGVRSFQSLQNMYETSSGHNTALIIDFAPKPDGSLPPEQVSTAKALGDYVSACYGAPIVQGSGTDMTLTLNPSAPVPMDRLQVREDLTNGQLIRGFTLTGMYANGTVANIFTGTSVGNKFIVVFPPLTLASITLNITGLAITAKNPFVKDFSAYSCEGVGESINDRLTAEGFPQPPYVVSAHRK